MQTAGLRRRLWYFIIYKSRLNISPGNPVCLSLLNLREQSSRKITGLILAVLVHPIRDFLQPLNAVRRLSAAGELVIFAFKQTGTGFDLQHFQRCEHFHRLRYGAGVVLEGMDEQRRCLAEVRVFQRRVIPHLFHVIPWLAAVMQIVVIADPGSAVIADPVGNRRWLAAGPRSDGYA